MQVPPPPPASGPPVFQQPVFMPPPPRRVRFEAIGEGWRWYMADIGQWILALILVLVITLGPIIVIQMIMTPMLISSRSGATPENPFGAMPSPNATLIQTAVMLPFSMLSQLVLNGMFRRGLLQIRGIRTNATEVFNLDGMGIQVFFFGILSVLINAPNQILWAYANPFLGGSYAGLVACVAVFFVMACLQLLLLFTPLIIVDQKLPAVQAMGVSVRTFGPQFLPLLGVMFVTTLLAACGAILCGVGALFTLPVYYVVVPVIYNDFFRPDPATLATQFASYYPRPAGPVETPKFQP